MSGITQELEEFRAMKSKRGSTNNKNRLEAFGNVSASGKADWGGCSPDKLQGVVVGITGLGGAITLGLARDMGAHSLTLLLDGKRKTLWFNGDADLDEALDMVLVTLDGMK